MTDECVNVTRYIVDALQQACQLYDESFTKFSVLTDATNQKISLMKHLAKECDLEVLKFAVLVSHSSCNQLSILF